MNETINDEQFGTLTWEPERDWWRGTLELPEGKQAALSLYPPEQRTITQQARDAFDIIARSDEAIRQKACDELLTIHNEAWNNGEPLDAETFKRRLTLEAIILYPDGSAELYFADDDMFWGHTVIVHRSEAGEYTDAVIAG